MTDREFLRTRSERLRLHLRRSAAALGQEVERVVGPAMREYPRSGLAAGTATGFVVGRALVAKRRAAPASARRGPLSGLFSFAGATGSLALRMALARSLLDGLSEKP